MHKKLVYESPKNAKHRIDEAGGACKYWKDQADGFHGLCMHPEARQGESCILNTEDECLLREEEMVTKKVLL